MKMNAHAAVSAVACIIILTKENKNIFFDPSADQKNTQYARLPVQPCI